jgi:hypothetical protein
MQAGWPERLYEVTGRQKMSFTIQLGFDFLHVVALVGSYAISQDPMVAVISYAVTYSAYHLTFLIGVYRVARFPARPLLGTLASGGTLFAAVVGLLALARVLSPAEPVLTAIVSLGMALAGGALIALRLRKVSQTVP